MDGDYDHINNRREASTLHVESEDGYIWRKEVAVDYQDYPETYTRHVRDPKVWKDDDAYFYGTRRTQKNDQGSCTDLQIRESQELDLRKGNHYRRTILDICGNARICLR